MKTSSHSWHKHLNDFVYGQGYSLNNTNLCPYFWGTIAAFIGVIPVAVFKCMRYPIPMKYRHNAGIGGFFTMIAGIIILAMVVNLDATLKVLYAIGISALVMLTLVVAAYFIAMGIRKIRPQKNKVPKPNIAIEMIKGWKNKHCPMLEWSE